MATANTGALLRAQVAAATRILNDEGLLTYSGHISARAPEGDRFYIQIRTEPRTEVRPESVLLVDMDCKVIEGDGKPPSETAIHAEIYRKRPDVHSVIHNHSEMAIAFTMTKTAKLLPMRARAARWKSGFPIHNDPSHIKRKEQGEALAATLGKHNVALMRAHGMVLVAESVPALLADTVHFEENAKAQAETLAMNAGLEPLTDEEMDIILKTEAREHHNKKLWQYYVTNGKKSGILDKSWDLD
jgi:L-ribulose-5-phosphate 4-epimerase